MSERRSQISRRRRIISATVLADEDSAGSSRRGRRKSSDSETREIANYGVHVNRRLRARWFELVPVRRRSLLAVKITIGFIVGLLIIGHYLSITVDSIREFPELARPLRLDSPTSFGRWVGATLMGLAACTSFLIYQLRRYRADDYRGKYRIWRPVIAMLLLLSIDSIANVLDWSGAIIDAVMSGNAPMAGADWIRLALCIAGFALTIRMVIEMRQSPLAAGWLVVGTLAVSSRLPIRWHFIEPSPMMAVIIDGAGPLVGRAAIFIAMLTFLRSVYRDVRRMEERPLLNLPNWIRRSPQVEDPEDQTPKKSTKRSRTVAAEFEFDEDLQERSGWFGWRRSIPLEEDDNSEEEQPKRRGWFGRQRDVEDEEEPRQSRSSRREATDSEDGSTDQPVKKRRGWFSKKDPVEPEDDSEALDSEDEVEVETAQPKRGWFKKRSVTETPDSDSDSADEEADSPSTEKRSGLSGWISRKSKSVESDEIAVEKQDAKPEPVQRPKPQSAVASPARDDSESIDADNIDWASMSKSERRRMKKLLRRQGKAA